MQQFSGRNTFGFTIQDVVGEFPQKDSVYLTRILVNMVDKGILCKIARDTLIRNFSNLNVLDY
jgi:dsRNA-specific ribonuclease